MKYIVYLTINTKSKINGLNRIYVGVHKTEDPTVFDGFIGDRVYINQTSTYMYPKTPFQYAVKKYGTDAFIRNVLYVYDNEDDAYKKESEIITKDFIRQDHVYNFRLGGKKFIKPVYQFNLKSQLIKKWEQFRFVPEFYNIPIQKFKYAIEDKFPIANSFWSYSSNINISEYSTKTWGSPQVTYLYSKNGKLLKEFKLKSECAEYIGKDVNFVSSAILKQQLINNRYYLSNSVVDEFIPKPRAQYIRETFFVYSNTGEFIGEYIGKSVMKVIGLHSWKKIRNFMATGGWYKNFFVSNHKVDTVPERKPIKIEVYDKYGTYIETLNSVKALKEKYNVPNSKVKDLEQGNKYFENWIFKYSK